MKDETKQLERLEYLKSMYAEITESIIKIKQEIKNKIKAQRHIRSAILLLDHNSLVREDSMFKYGELLERAKSIVCSSDGIHAKTVIIKIMESLRQEGIVNDDNSKKIKKTIDAPIRSALYSMNKKMIISRYENEDGRVMWRGLIHHQQ